ncbi:MAG: HEPN domain-containing protein [Deltaproteobacteria bacterium]|nr:HEPN domain-containing protein [Deltaproteobacteria bacterium]
MQAKDDLEFARCALKEEFFAQCCFVCQQAAEKALKALLFKRGVRVILTHSVLKLCQELRLNGRLRKAAGVLDQYYLSGRYPDALPGGAPFEAFSRDQARESLELASGLIAAVERRFKR